METPHKPDPDHDEPLRPHTYDGIQEYDKRLPNWWLLTFYGAIVFAVVYWFYFRHSGVAISDGARVEAEMAQVEAARLAGASSFNDDTLWEMSRNPVFVEAGRATFNTTCVTCHLASLRGKDENPTAIGVNLVDANWLYGGRPTEVFGTVDKGTAKGMPAWGPSLGPKKVSEVVAFVFSHHKQSEAGGPAQLTSAR